MKDNNSRTICEYSCDIKYLQISRENYQCQGHNIRP